MKYKKIVSNVSRWSSSIIPKCITNVNHSKKDKSIIFCVDYRNPNQMTQFDPEPNAQNENIINSLIKAKYFSKLDVTIGHR